MKILMVCSSGGHLAQLHALRPWWQEHDRQWVTFDSADAHSLLADEKVVFGYSPTTRNVPNLLRNFRLARRVLHGYRPDLIVSTGAAMALPYFVLARAYGARTAYLEVIDRIETPTVTGRACYPLSDHFLVQWPVQQEFYPRSTVVGAVL